MKALGHTIKPNWMNKLSDDIDEGVSTRWEGAGGYRWEKIGIQGRGKKNTVKLNWLDTLF